MLRQDLITLAFTRGNARLWELSRLWQVRLPLLIYSVVSVSVRQLLLHKLQKAHTTLKKRVPEEHAGSGNHFHTGDG